MSRQSTRGKNSLFNRLCDLHLFRQAGPFCPLIQHLGAMCLLSSNDFKFITCDNLNEMGSVSCVRTKNHHWQTCFF